jgi:protein-S-isoprenylcysteine O-methyltransferase Ste14
MNIPSTNELIAFAALSAVIIIFSWHVILNFKAHGFYRFLGWECLAWLLVNNFKHWFENPFSIFQIISWILLFYAMFLIIVGVILMKTKGKADKTREDTTLYSFERTTELIEIGIYKYIRHPLYGSLVFLIWGIFFKNPAIDLLVISIIATVFFFATSMIEEKEKIKYFGEKYRDYMKRSKMFIPFLV